MLVRGGLKSITPDFVTKALQSTQKTRNKSLEFNRYQNKRWYCFAGGGKEYETPMDQVKILRDKLKAASSDEEKEALQPPTIPCNHFSMMELKHLKKYVAAKPAPTTFTKKKKNPSPSTNTATPKRTKNKASAPIVTPHLKLNNNKKNISHVPIKGINDSNSLQRTGIVLMDLDGLDDFTTNIVEKHARTCPSGSLKVVNQVKEGWDLDRTYYCAFCKKSFDMSTGPPPDQDPSIKKKRGRQGRTINKMMSVATFNCGTPAAQVQELFHDAGVVCPSKKGQQKMLDKAKEAIKDVSEEELKQNRKKHVAEVRKMATYQGDHIFKDSSGKEHSISVGPVSVDGNGEKRAYGHIVTWRTTCYCHYQFESNKKRATDITAQDLDHPGKKCYVNSKHNPASAEEWALESLAKFLLIDPDTGELRPDDEAILVNHVIGDGDTKGPNKFIKKQVEIVPSFQGKAEYLPDIGHFIKCISNSFFALATKNAELRGKCLLEAPRIRCMCGDISKYLREYGDDYRKWSSSDDIDAEEKLNKSRDRALNRIDALVHHHCGDHKYCASTDCLFRDTENRHVAKHRVETDDNKSRDEIIELCVDEINEAYSAKSRFKGMSMSMGEGGRAKIRNEITKRLDSKNIDRVALAMSSNGCENYFSQLVKYTCGKRIYFGRKDGWEVRCKFVAAKKSDARLTNKVRREMGVLSTSAVREQSITRLLKEKEYQAAYQQQEKCKARRKAKKLISSKTVVSNSKNPARHKTGKLSPKEVVKSTVNKTTEASQNKRRKNPCPNCKGWHPGKCIEPEYKAKKKKVKTKFDASYMASLFRS
ncbi:hypothetical protein ACHAXR_007193 [Thalassiosira sp. AJA248-18]